MLYKNDEMVHHETIFGLEATQLKFGTNSLSELGWELSKYNFKKILLVIDPILHEFDVTQKILDQTKSLKAETIIYDNIVVEPTLKSFETASQFAQKHSFELIIAVGGGSTIDTAKVSNLIKVCGGKVMDYVNSPVGGGKKIDPTAVRIVFATFTTTLNSAINPAKVVNIPKIF